MNTRRRLLKHMNITSKQVEEEGVGFLKHTNKKSK
jgi:hypothetical protein